MDTTLPTSEGQQTIPEIMETLAYSSYCANRDYGMTHEQLVRIGIGNDAMKLCYESNKPKKENLLYSSPYPALVVYTSDKNFDVRLKALIDRRIKEAGIPCTFEQLKALTDSLNDAEDYLFASKVS